MLAKANWPLFVQALTDAGLVFTASLSRKKDKSQANHDHINLTAFNVLLEHNIAVPNRHGSTATKVNARQEPLFGLTSISQLKDAHLKKAHMLTITPDVEADIESWGVKQLQQRYPAKKVGHPDSALDDQQNSLKSLFLLGELFSLSSIQLLKPPPSSPSRRPCGIYRLSRP
jgi:hypothetical protein